MGSISASNNDNMSSRNCVADVGMLGEVAESSGVISVSSRAAGEAVGSAVSRQEAESVISMSSECDGLGGGDGAGAGCAVSVRGECSGASCRTVRVPDVVGGRAINEGVFFFAVSKAFRAFFVVTTGGETAGGSVTVGTCMATEATFGAGRARIGSVRGLGGPRGTRASRDIDHR